MKRIFLLLTIVIISVCFNPIVKSQSYLKVSSTDHWNNNESGKFDNIYVFKFSPSFSYFSDYKKCRISFYVYDSEGNVLPDNHLVRAVTGYKHNYTEAEDSSTPEGLVQLTITTENLFELNLVVGYMGSDYGAHLENVEFEYYDKKF